MKLLIADDDKVTRDLLKEIFEAEKYEVSVVSSGEDALRTLGQEAFPLVLSDIRMLDVDGLAVLSHLKRTGSKTVVILMTGFGTMEGAIGAVQHGAFDYISKPFKINELKAVVSRASKHWQSLQEPSAMEAAPLPTGDFASRTLLGKSPQIVEVYKTLARATISPSNVLIIGESGTGKELVARGIHENSPRRRKPFVAVNCGALTESLLESELFGHVKGAFTGAIANKHGLFEEANGGTLFLDEIGDMTPALQVKLLRVIQEGELKRVGSNEVHRCDVRVIAATHQDLEAQISQGSFREDLYYRLKVVRIELPPLRERIGDLSELVGFFLARYADKIGKKVSHVSDEAMQNLQRYPWPGNVRELEHAIERAVTMTRTTMLYPEDFPPEITHYTGEGVAGGKALPSTSLEEVERQHILRVLEEANYNKSRAAAILGIDRKTLHRKAQRYRIQLKEK